MVRRDRVAGMGFTGTSTGSDLATCETPVPVARVWWVLTRCSHQLKPKLLVLRERETK